MIAVTGIGAGVSAQEGARPSGFQDHVGQEVPVAFFYPSSWTVVDRDESVGIVSRPALAQQLGADQPDIEAGDAMLALGVIPVMFVEMMGASADDLGSVTDMLFDNITTQSGEIGTADQQAHAYNAGDVVSVLFETGSPVGAGLMLVSRESADVLAFGVAFGSHNDLSAYRDELAQVVATVEFTGTMQDFYE